MNPYFDSQGLHVAPQMVQERLRRPRLSPSSAKSVRSCAARWAIERLCRAPGDAFSPAEQGTVAHWVFEHLFALPVTERTQQAAYALLESVDPPTAAQNDLVLPDQADRERWLGEVRELLDGLWVLEDPSQVVVTGTERKLDHAVVNGVPFVGIIDRTELAFDAEGRVCGVEVSDYKGLALDTPLPSPNGWLTMGQVRPGDWLFGTGGRPVAVAGKSAIHRRRCFELVFDDGEHLVADDVHLWRVRVGRTVHDPVSTLGVRALLARRKPVLVDVPKPVDMPANPGVDDAYAFGAQVLATGVLHPSMWRLSLQQRARFVQAWCDARARIVEGSVVFAGPEPLVEAMASLVASMGMAFSRTPGAVSFAPTRFQPFTAMAFRPPRTVTRTRRIVSVTEVEPVLTQCIEVDAPDSMYLAGRTFVPTHNTARKGAKSDFARRTFGDDHGDQTRLYALALESIDGRVPESLKVLYTATGQVYRPSLARRELDRVAQEFAAAWTDLNNFCAAGTFPAHASPLCGWCPAWSVCPQAQNDARSSNVFDAENAGVTNAMEELMKAVLGLCDPWDEYDDAGMLNGNSPAFSNALALVELASSLLNDAAIPQTRSTVLELSTLLGQAVADATQALSGSGSLATNLASTLTGALPGVVAQLPAPESMIDVVEDAAAWREALTKRLISMSKVAAAVHRSHA